jgi:uncharacterized membrane protein YphA (DoxX/SURF4 family)
MNTYTKFQNWVLLALRIIVAAVFLVAAYYKLPFWYGEATGMPTLMVYIMQFLSIVEPLGAIAVLGGFLTRWAATGLSVIMVGAIFAVKFTMGMGFVTPTGAGWNFPLSVLGGCLILMAFGAGKFSIEGRKNQ